MARLEGASAFRADMTWGSFIRADLPEVNFSGSNLRRTAFLSADLTDADLTDTDLTDANLTGADLSGADLSGANLSGANFSEANLSGEDWSRRATLVNVCYDEETTWPSGYDPPGQPNCATEPADDP